MSIGSQTEQLEPSTRLRRPKKDKTSTEISKTYKHASQLYLTRRLAECYEALQPVIKPKSSDFKGSEVEDESESHAPIALASTSQRIKTWSLYAALLNAIIDLGDEEGKRDFGKGYREIVRSVQSGAVWESVVRDGYMGRESSVDAEVVYNLSNLLLQKAQDQTINQTRLETYLSTSFGALPTDLSSHFTNGHSFHGSGMNTPKDLSSRVKILELFTLHVLPQNNEWEYARSFVSNSDILDEERREALLQTLSELQEAREATEAEDLVGFDEETEDEKIQMNDTLQIEGRQSRHGRTSSEVDYGIDDTLQPDAHPNGTSMQTNAQNGISNVQTNAQSNGGTGINSVKKPQPAKTISPSRVKSPTRTIRKPTPAPKKTDKKAVQRSGLSKLLLVLANLTSSIKASLTTNPTQVFRTIMFLFAFLAVLARKDVRERLKRIMGNGWLKVRQTAGMGVKVSYV